MGNINSTYCTNPSNLNERQQFCEGWTSCVAGKLPKYPYMWKYQNETSTGSYRTKGYVNSYPGSGYVVCLLSSNVETDSLLTNLSQNFWLDDATSAVFVEFTVYNSQVNLYTVATLILEIPENGGASVFKRILTVRLDRYSSSFSIFLGVCETSFIVFVFYQFYLQLKKVANLQMNYFKDTTNLMELASFLFIFAALILYIVRMVIVSKVKKKYFNNRDAFVSFESATQADEAYGNTFACVTFLVIVKSLNALRFNSKMSRLYLTVSYAQRGLACFTILFLVVFLAYSFTGYLLFHKHLVDFSTVIGTMQSLFNLLLGKVELTAVLEDNKTVGNVFFITFGFLMTMVLLNMFISIICDAFYRTQHKLSSRENKFDLISFISKRLIAFFPPCLARIFQKTYVFQKKLAGAKRWKNKRKGILKVTFQENSSLMGNALQGLEENTPWQKLEEAIDKMSSYVDHMLEEEEYQTRVLEILIQLYRSKTSVG